MTALDTLARLLRARSGLVVGPDKLYLLETRLAPMLRREGLPDLDTLAQHLLSHGDASPLMQEVVEAMATHETLFFRDPRRFVHLQEQGLPALARARPPGQALRIWSAAASTGQEAYSLAMAAVECQAALAGRKVQIIGTDIARPPLARARAGLYTQFEVQRGLPVQRLLTYFDQQGDSWRVRPQLRALCEFRTWNLLDDPAPLGCFDVVFCRNVLIYFDTDTKAQVLASIARQMAPDGLLYLGGAETAIGISPCFEPDEQEHTVYRPVRMRQESAA
ncbi:MAG: protein-glutamate O-methyltransferase CheR [Acetobacteraceae bacterium]